MNAQQQLELEVPHVSALLIIKRPHSVALLIHCEVIQERKCKLAHSRYRLRLILVNCVLVELRVQDPSYCVRQPVRVRRFELHLRLPISRDQVFYKSNEVRSSVHKSVQIYVRQIHRIQLLRQSWRLDRFILLQYLLAFPLRVEHFFFLKCALLRQVHVQLGNIRILVNILAEDVKQRPFNAHLHHPSILQTPSFFQISGVSVS